MPLSPFSIVWIWLRGLISIAIIVAGIALLRGWYKESQVWVPDRVYVSQPRDGNSARELDPDRALTVVEPAEPGRIVFHYEPGFNRATAMLAGGLALLTWAFAGGLIAKGIFMILLKQGADDPKRERAGAEVHTLKRPNGAELHVECYGPPDAQPIVMTHGWGADATEWYYVKKHLADRFRLIVWDLPGLGLSKKPDDNDYRLETMARDLDAVVSLANGRPAILLGHSIGGMITLTYPKIFPEALGGRVAGLALVHTTYTDPIHTMKNAEIKTALEKPLVVPLLHLTIGLWPLVWLMTWLGYLNGSAHRSTHKDSFAGTETRGELNFAAGFLPRARPDILARGMFGMMRYDSTDVLPKIDVPSLVIIGDQDVTTLPDAGKRIAAGIPSAKLLTLAPGKHMGLIERHSEFNAAVAEFAASCQPTPVQGY